MRFRQIVFPYHVWPAYEYASDHISNLNAHVKEVLKKRGLPQPEDFAQYEPRIFCNVHVVFIYQFEEEMLSFDEVFTEYRHSALQERKRGYVQLLPDLYGSKKQTDHEPVFFLAKDRTYFSWIEYYILSTISRLHFVLIQDDKKDRVQSSQNFKCHQNFSCSRLSETLSRIDDLLEEYSFEIVKRETKYLLELKKTACGSDRNSGMRRRKKKHFHDTICKSIYTCLYLKLSFFLFTYS